MEYWVIVGEGGGFDEVKSVKSGSSGAQTGGINKTTVRITRCLRASRAG